MKRIALFGNGFFQSAFLVELQPNHEKQILADTLKLKIQDEDFVIERFDLLNLKEDNMQNVDTIVYLESNDEDIEVYIEATKQAKPVFKYDFNTSGSAKDFMDTVAKELKVRSEPDIKLQTQSNYSPRQFHHAVQPPKEVESYQSNCQLK